MNKKPMISHHVASAGSRPPPCFRARSRPDGVSSASTTTRRSTPQRIIVNIDLSVQEGEGPKDDDIGHVVSYEIVVKKVEAIIAEGHINLVETLCEKIAAACLRDSASWRPGCASRSPTSFRTPAASASKSSAHAEAGRQGAAACQQSPGGRLQRPLPASYLGGMSESDQAPTGPEIIHDFVTRLPGKPGVYRMYDAKGDVIYVGKARNLKNRVSNYTRFGGHTSRIAAMISLTRQHGVRDHQYRSRSAAARGQSHQEAEAALQRGAARRQVLSLHPDRHATIRWRSSPSIAVRATARATTIGPFASAGAVNRAINTLQKAFLLRSCNDSVYANRTRPCLLYQIKRCAAPCVGYVEPAAYDDLVAEAEAFLGGKSQAVKAELARQMEEAAERLDFEQAARIRDRIQAMSFVTAQQGINPQTVDEADVFGLAQEGGQTCIQVFFFRSGQNWGNRAYYPKADRAAEAAEVLAAFLAQFYDDKPVPGLILLSHDIEERALLEEALSTHAGHKVEIAVPQRGEKKAAGRACRHQCARGAGSQDGRILLAGEAARRRGSGSSGWRRRRVGSRSTTIPISRARNAVGAMIVAGPEGFMKSQYRKFNIRTEDASAGRLRHDARGAHPPLHPADQGTG